MENKEDSKRSLHEVASNSKFHHLIPAALSESDVNGRDLYRRTALHLALESDCSLETLNVLREAGADVRARDEYEQNALYWAVVGDCSNEVIDQLLECSIELLYEENSSHRSPLFYAAMKKRLDYFIPFLVKHQQTNYQDSRNQTLLHLALISKCRRSVESVLQLMSPASLNETNIDCDTYLHFAVNELCSPEIIGSLLNAGLNPATKNESGNNALQHLMMDSRWRRYQPNQLYLVLKKLLRGHPEIFTDRDSTGKFPLDYVVDMRPLDIRRRSRTVIALTLKWFLLQNDADFQWRQISDAPELELTVRRWLQQCRSELELLRAFRVTNTLSLGDLVKACFASPKFIDELRVEKRFVRVLQFGGNLMIAYKHEVNEVVRMVRACSSLYGKTLPFPAFEKGVFVKLSQKVLDYLNVNDLEQLAIAIK